MSVTYSCLVAHRKTAGIKHQSKKMIGGNERNIAEGEKYIGRKSAASAVAKKRRNRDILSRSEYS